jgi:hypothetical protein
MGGFKEPNAPTRFQGLWHNTNLSITPIVHWNIQVIERIMYACSMDGANPTTSIYNARVVKIYYATNSIALF